VYIALEILRRSRQAGWDMKDIYSYKRHFGRRASKFLNSSAHIIQSHGWQKVPHDLELYKSLFRRTGKLEVRMSFDLPKLIAGRNEVLRGRHKEPANCQSGATLNQSLHRRFWYVADEGAILKCLTCSVQCPRQTHRLSRVPCVHPSELGRTKSEMDLSKWYVRGPLASLIK
jgi:hypothetical protein